MKKRQWSIQRHIVKRADGQQRWDQAYQYLVQWSAASPQGPSHGASSQESIDESSDVRPRLYTATGAGANH